MNESSQAVAELRRQARDFRRGYAMVMDADAAVQLEAIAKYIERLEVIRAAACDPEFVDRVRENIKSAERVKALFAEKRPGEEAVVCDTAIRVQGAFLAAIEPKNGTGT